MTIPQGQVLHDRLTRGERLALDEQQTLDAWYREQDHAESVLLEQMDQTKRVRLEAHGWKVGTTAEFLDLTLEESALIEIKLALSENLRQRREHQMTQAELAKKLAANPKEVVDDNRNG